MFFRRNEGQYRETDRVTRFKLVKSGKHWLRAATSHFGLFKIISGRVDASSVSEAAKTSVVGLTVCSTADGLVTSSA